MRLVAVILHLDAASGIDSGDHVHRPVDVLLVEDRDVTRTGVRRRDDTHLGVEDVVTADAADGAENQAHGDNIVDRFGPHGLGIVVVDDRAAGVERDRAGCSRVYLRPQIDRAAGNRETLEQSGDDERARRHPRRGR